MPQLAADDVGHAADQPIVEELEHQLDHTLTPPSHTHNPPYPHPPPPLLTHTPPPPPPPPPPSNTHTNTTPPPPTTPKSPPKKN